MYESEIEYFNEVTDELNDFKNASHNDEDFKDFVRKHGAEHSLYLATTLHREIADQIKVWNENDMQEEAGEWRRKAVRAVGGLKKRRQQLRRIVTEIHGQDAVEEINQQVLEESEDLT